MSEIERPFQVGDRVKCIDPTPSLIRIKVPPSGGVVAAWVDGYVKLRDNANDEKKKHRRAVNGQGRNP